MEQLICMEDFCVTEEGEIDWEAETVLRSPGSSGYLGIEGADITVTPEVYLPEDDMPGTAAVGKQ